MGEEKKKKKDKKLKEHRKVLFCASAASHIINFHNIYFEHLNSIGFEIHTATGINKNANDNSDINLINAKKTFVLTFEKGKKFFFNIKTVFIISKIIRSEKYEIVSTHSMLAGLIGRLAVILSCNKKTKVIHTCHGYLFGDDKSFKSRMMILTEKFLSLRTDVLFVMNNDDYKIAEKYKLCGKTGNIKYINGIGLDVKKLKSKFKTTHELYRKYKIPENKKYFLCVGEFSKRKNQKNIIRAFSIFIKNLSDNLCNPYHLIFLGDGVLLDECIRLCETLGIKDNVTFCGYTVDTSAFYDSIAYCVVSASEFEGLPFNIMEALYYGNPVIASDVKGHKDLISGGFNGYLYGYNDDIRLFECLEKISDAEIYENLKSNAYLDEKYYFENVREKVLSCYENMQ